MFKFIFNYFKEENHEIKTEISKNDLSDNFCTIFSRIYENKPMLNPFMQLPIDSTIGRRVDGKYYVACFTTTLDVIQKELPLKSLEITRVYGEKDIKVKFLISEYKQYVGSPRMDLFEQLIKLEKQIKLASTETLNHLDSQYRDTILVVEDAFKDLHKLSDDDIENLIAIIIQIIDDTKEFVKDEVSSLSSKIKFEVEYLNKIKQSRQEMKDFGFE